MHRPRGTTTGTMTAPRFTEPQRTQVRFPGKLFGGVLVGLAVAALAAGFFIDHHGKFGIDGTIGFYAWYGALSAVVFAAAAFILGVVAGRPDDHHDR